MPEHIFLGIRIASLLPALFKGLNFKETWVFGLYYACCYLALEKNICKYHNQAY